jgi:hypothetical protein
MKIKRSFGDQVEVFSGEETAGETLSRLGVRSSLRPAALEQAVEYDEMRLSFAREWIKRADYLKERPADRSGYKGFGSKQDRLVTRLQDSARKKSLPLIRAHLGPYLPDRREAMKLFLDWCGVLAAGAFLDVLSIGTSQLSQSHFGEIWGDRPNGGGLPINSEEEYYSIWQASRPMLVRTYAGTNRISQLARMYEQTINIAWHAFSLWWFCRIDGRGPLSVLENLQQHLSALRFVAETGKPFEPNVPHHFAFRGGDDITYIVSAILAARTAKELGVRYLILQNMLNTPRGTWGIQDLAKSRAILTLIHELEDGRFSVFLQPRAGLDYFSPDLEKARIQLAAVSALMDDIEPGNPSSPPLVHVVSFSEGSHLADPSIINESIKITRSSIKEYRKLKTAGKVPDMVDSPEVSRRYKELLTGARTILKAIEKSVTRPYTAEGLHEILAAGFLPVPHLDRCREEFKQAVQWKTTLIQGSVKTIDAAGRPLSAQEMAAQVFDSLQASNSPRAT